MCEHQHRRARGFLIKQIRNPVYAYGPASGIVIYIKTFTHSFTHATMPQSAHKAEAAACLEA
jgi:hypothetical protein